VLWVKADQSVFFDIDRIVIERMEIEGTPTGGGYVVVHFTRNNERTLARISADLNGDGTYTEDETLLEDFPAAVKKGSMNRLAFRTEREFPDGETIPVRLGFSHAGDAGSEIAAVAEASMQKVNVVGAWDITSPGSSELRKRGIGAMQLAYADDGGEVEIMTEGEVPDLSGGPMDCFPIAAANNLSALAERNDFDGDLPEPEAMRDELKAGMQFENGVLEGGFLAGKQAFIDKYNLPVQTEVIENPTFEDIKDALESGHGVELSMSHIRSASGHANAGHVVTAVGAISSGGQFGIVAHDPATPAGSDDVMEITPPPSEGAQVWLVDYPLWDGVTFIDHIYVQKWIDAEAQPATTGTQTDGGDATSRIQVLVIGGSYYPLSQFKVARPDSCESDHYHAGTVFGLADKASTNIVSATDPLPRSCGFGKVSEVPIEWIDITYEQSVELAKHVVR
jgi:hypothetical protein